MKKIVLILMTVSLLLTGCSDDDEKNTSDSKENTTSAMETLTTESVTNARFSRQNQGSPKHKPPQKKTTMKLKLIIP